MFILEGLVTIPGTPATKSIDDEVSELLKGTSKKSKTDPGIKAGGEESDADFTRRIIDGAHGKTYNTDRKGTNNKDTFTATMPGSNRDFKSLENIAEGTQAVTLVCRSTRVANACSTLGWVGKAAPWLGPISGTVAVLDMRSDYLNYYGSTIDENGDEIYNSLYDVRQHAKEQGIKLTPEQEQREAAKLESQRGRDLAINTVCTGAGTAYGVAVGVGWGIAGAKGGAAIGAAIGVWFGGVGAVPGAIIGGVIGAVGGFIAGVGAGAAIGNMVGSAVKGICNFFGGLSFSRRGGYS